MRPDCGAERSTVNAPAFLPPRLLCPKASNTSQPLWASASYSCLVTVLGHFVALRDLPDVLRQHGPASDRRR